MLDIERAEYFDYRKNFNTRVLGEYCKERNTHYGEYRTDDSFDQLRLGVRGLRKWMGTKNYREYRPDSVIDIGVLGF